MLNKETIEALATQLASRAEGLEAWLKNYQWKKANLAEAWPVRQTLQFHRFDGNHVQYADDVHRWGFGAAVSATVRTDPVYAPGLVELCRTWADHPTPWGNTEAVEALVNLLNISGFKIARVSKLVCFLDHDRLAIYDSRVSYALKDLCVNGRRVFPFVGGRAAPKGKGPYVGADAAMSDPRLSANIYIDFLRLMQRTAAKMNANGGIHDIALRNILGTASWTPALLEMALFMEGQERNAGPDIARLA